MFGKLSSSVIQDIFVDKLLPRCPWKWQARSDWLNFPAGKNLLHWNMICLLVISTICHLSGLLTWWLNGTLSFNMAALQSLRGSTFQPPSITEVNSTWYSSLCWHSFLPVCCPARYKWTNDSFNGLLDKYVELWDNLILPLYESHLPLDSIPTHCSVVKQVPVERIQWQPNYLIQKEPGLLCDNLNSCRHFQDLDKYEVKKIPIFTL